MEPAPADEPVTVLVVEPDAVGRRSLARHLGASAGRVLDVGTVEEAGTTCRRRPVDLVVASATLPGDGVLALCAELRGRGAPPVVAYGLDVATLDAARWLGAGGAGCVPGDEPALVAAHCRAVLRRSLAPLRLRLLHQAQEVQ